jgi:hypothetical protein
MPQRLQVTKKHKKKVINTIPLVNLRVFVPLWQIFDFSYWTH